MNLPNITVIILNWNGRDFLGDCLTSVLALEYPSFHTILVDNCSSDDSVAFVKTHFPQVEVIENEANLGFAAGNNAVLRNWQGEIAVLLNPDVTVNSAWLNHLVQPLLDDENVGISGGKLLYPDGTLQHAGGRLIPPLSIPTHFGSGEPDEGQYDQELDVEYVIGAALAFNSRLLAEIGLLDEEFFLYFEDVDFCLRARQAGFRVVYTPLAVAVHLESATIGKGSHHYLTQFHTSRWRFLLKHSHFEELVREAMLAEHHWLSRISVSEHTAVLNGYQEARRFLPLQFNVPVGGTFSPAQIQRLDLELKQLELMVGYMITAQTTAANPIDPLQLFSQIREQPFESDIPLLGPLVAAFRKLWNSVSTQWYVRPMLQQQNQLNELLVIRIRGLEAKLNSQGQELTSLILKHRELLAQQHEHSGLLQKTRDADSETPE